MSQHGSAVASAAELAMRDDVLDDGKRLASSRQVRYNDEHARRNELAIDERTEAAETRIRKQRLPGLLEGGLITRRDVRRVKVTIEP